MSRFENQFNRLLISWVKYVTKVEEYATRILNTQDYCPRNEFKSLRRLRHVSSILKLVQYIREGFFIHLSHPQEKERGLIVELESKGYRARKSLFDIVQFCQMPGDKK